MDFLFAKTDKEFDEAGTSADACEALIRKLVKTRRFMFYGVLALAALIIWSLLHGPISPELEGTHPLRPAVLFSFIIFGVLHAACMQCDAQIKVLKVVASALKNKQ